MKEVYDLDVYKLAEELSGLIWGEFDKWPIKAQNTICYQIIRASDSIASNLAEGYGRFTPANRKKIYYYSRGSFGGDQGVATQGHEKKGNYFERTNG